MMNNRPMVSIGIPTYNRPEGLRKVLEKVTNQTYINIEIIVSDNCSEKAEVAEIAQEFQKKDKRVLFHRQTFNQGPTNNFKFVLKESKSNYFIWAADDDEWVEDNFLEKLVDEIEGRILVFSKALSISGENEKDLLNCYANCITETDYLNAWCSDSTGYPFYGLYNLEEFYKEGLAFIFDDDLAYHGEGVFLHKIFLSGKVKYVPQVSIKFNIEGSKPKIEILVDTFVKYFQRTIPLYVEDDNKKKAFDLFFTLFINHYNHIFKESLQLPIPNKLSFYRRFRTALRILIKGY